jgi:hypothetical protein
VFRITSISKRSLAMKLSISGSPRVAFAFALAFLATQLVAIAIMPKTSDLTDLEMNRIHGTQIGAPVDMWCVASTACPCTSSGLCQHQGSSQCLASKQTVCTALPNYDGCEGGAPPGSTCSETGQSTCKTVHKCKLLSNNNCTQGALESSVVVPDVCT